MWFKLISGLKINLDKSELIPIEGVSNVEGLALMLGCEVRKFPTSYLSPPLGASHKQNFSGLGCSKGGV